MHLQIDEDYVLGALRDLVHINSVNPALMNDAPGEAEIASYVWNALDAIGLDTKRIESTPGRTSVVGKRDGRGNGKSLMLNAHLDTVGVVGMDEPFSARVEGGRLYGRGSYDMKGALAACLGAAKALGDARINLAGDLLIAAVADEEHASIGMSDVIGVYDVDAAIVTEPTQLEICLAHKGFAWIEIETFGKAAHGSQFTLGVDANMSMGRVLAELELMQQRFKNSPGHSLLGRPSLHAALVQGGTAESVYAANCRLTVERRTIPGETESQVMGEMLQIIEKLKVSDPKFVATAASKLYRQPFEVSQRAEIVQALEKTATAVLGATPSFVGENPWMDSALLAEAGVETVVMGPSGGGAHSDEEWVEIESVIALAEILARTAIEYCGT